MKPPDQDLQCLHAVSERTVLIETITRLEMCRIVLLRSFLFFTTNQFAQKFKILANLILITYFVNICNIYTSTKCFAAWL